MRLRKTFVAILAIGLFLSTGELNASAENSNPSEVISKNLLTGEETTVSVSVSDVQALLEEAGASTSSYEGSGEDGKPLGLIEARHLPLTEQFG